MPQIKVYRKDTGEIVRVPAHFMDHPVLSKPFRKTPSQKTRDLAKEAEAEAAAEQAALAALQTSTERAGTAASTTPKSTRASEKPGDANQEA